MIRKKRSREAGPAKSFTTIARIGADSNLFFFISLVLSFLISFSLYWFTLAPTVTFEDSGELIAAAYTLGIPHQPGYPLFTLLGRVFSLLPFENAAFRLNLMSAFLSALGAMWLTWAVILLIEDCFIFGVKRKTKSLASVEQVGKSEIQSAPPGNLIPEKVARSIGANRDEIIKDFKSPILKYASALSAGILMATAFENWEQSIITEVYGLNTMFVGLILFLAILWRRQAGKTARIRYFLLICFILGLTFSNHTTSLMFLPILFIFALSEDWKFILNPKIMLSGIGFLTLGLAPYIYLPIASARNPLVDWGNPENLTNLLRTVSRHQYGLGGGRNFARFLDQFNVYLNLLLEQWFPLFLMFALIGLFALFKSRRIYFYFSLIFLLFAAPLTTYLTDFEVSGSDSFLAAENRALVSVFYIPSYIYLACLMGIGIFYLAVALKACLGENLMAEYGMTLLIVLLPLGAAYPHYQKLDMSRYYFTEDYAENLFKVAEKNALVIANWDPFYFPLNYYQFVEGRRPDIIAIDQELLRRSWYIHWLRQQYPKFVQLAASEAEAFLVAVAPFENDQPYDGNFIQTKYIAMINAFIDRAFENDRPIYLAIYKRPLPSGIAPGYTAEPMVAAFRLRKDANGITPLNIGNLEFRYFFDDSVPKDRMARMMHEYYATLLMNRAQYCERREEIRLARKYYQITRLFFTPHPRVIGQIDAALRRLEGQP